MFPVMDPLLVLAPSTRVGLSVSSLIPYCLSLVSGKVNESSLGTQSNFPKRLHTDLESISQFHIDIRDLPSAPFSLSQYRGIDVHPPPQFAPVTTVPSPATSVSSKLVIS